MILKVFFHLLVLINSSKSLLAISNEVAVEEIKSDLVKKSLETSINLSKIVDEEAAVGKLNQILKAHALNTPEQLVATRIKSIASVIAAKINKYQEHLLNSNDGQVLIEEDLKQTIGSLLDDEHEDVSDQLDPSLFVYHRLDQLPKKPKLCKYFKQLATLDTSTLFLSSNAFENPLGFISEPETSDQIVRLTSFFNNCSRNAANPGLRPDVKSEVQSLTRITKTWKGRATVSPLSKYIVRRYIASHSGVFIAYPGTVLERTYHPSQRDWFKRAAQLPGRIIFTAPYLDVGGAGYIVTLSRTFQEKKPDGTTSSMQGVIGLDFTLGYFHKLLMASMDVCNKNQITCFLMDDRGYLVAHPSLVEPAGRGPIEYTHVTHKEPLVANDLLNHKNFVQKKVCNSLSDCTIQRYYNFNMSLDGILTNLVHGEHCAKYQITTIPGTNLFVGVVNETCDTMTAFCPCSMTDRLCLNCHRMEQTDCECPCECPLETCSALDFEPKEEDSDCNPHSEELVLPIVERAETVPSCFQVDCSTRKTENDCLGVLGCEWCQLDTTGSELDKKFCNYQRECFGGVLGIRTPYTDEYSDHDSMSEVPFPRVTPFSSIIFVFITCFVLLSFVVYCYRFHVQRAACALYPSDGGDNTNVRMSQLDNEPDDLEPVIEEVIKPIVQPNAVVMLAHAATVSPYRLNPGYRRPPGGDSDNGYSTMTAHDDSEHLGPSCDPLLAGRDRQAIQAHHSAHSLGSSSRTSSPLDAPLPTNNDLKAKNSLPVPMTALPPSKGDLSTVIAQVHNVVDAL